MDSCFTGQNPNQENNNGKSLLRCLIVLPRFLTVRHYLDRFPTQFKVILLSS